MVRYVTVPFQLIELELFEHFSFFRTLNVEQFISSELEMMTSSLPELKMLTSSFHLNWR